MITSTEERKANRTAVNVKPTGANVTPALLYAVSFTAGFVILILEVLGFRMFAPYFGYSVFVSGSLISLVLIALSCGYYIGGKIADENPQIALLFRFVLISTIYLAIITLTYRYILSAMAAIPPVIGTALAAIIIFGLPMVLLSMVTPFLVKIISSSHTEKIGQIVGTISSISTVGSIAGSIVTTFVLLPGIGTFATTVTAVVLLIVVLLLLSFSVKKTMKAAMALPLAIASCGFLFTEKDPDCVFAKESVYNLVEVFNKGGYYRLKLNKGKDTHTIFTNDLHSGKFFIKSRFDTYLSSAIPMSGGRDILILGLGGGSSANQAVIEYPDANVEAIEIDPVVYDVARKFFSIDKINPRLKVHVMDGRTFINNCEKTYDVLQIDMYHGGVYMPFYVGTQEFFLKASKCLKSNGVIAMNVLGNNTAPGGDELVEAIGNTMSTVFKSLFIFRNKETPSNVLLFGFNERVTLQEVKDRMMNDFAAKPGRFDIKPILQEVSDMLHEYRYAYDSPILTDNKAPIEQITYRVYNNFVKTWNLNRPKT